MSATILHFPSGSGTPDMPTPHSAAQQCLMTPIEAAVTKEFFLNDSASIDWNCMGLFEMKWFASVQEMKVTFFARKDDKFAVFKSRE